MVWMKKSNPALATDAWVKAHPLPTGTQGGMFYKKPSVDNSRTLGVWKYDSEGNLHCSKCGMMEPDSMPKGCTIWPDEKRYCFFCGARLLHPNDLK